MSEENTVSRGDLIDKIKAYEVDLDKAKLSSAMKLFKKYDLIDFNLKDESENAVITLYPSLQFGWDVEQFRVITAEYLGNSENEEEAADAERLDEEDEE